MSLSTLVDRYMRVYAGRDPARAYRLTAWCAKLGPDRPFVEISGREPRSTCRAVSAFGWVGPQTSVEGSRINQWFSRRNRNICRLSSHLS